MFSSVSLAAEAAAAVTLTTATSTVIVENTISDGAGADRINGAEVAHRADWRHGARTFDCVQKLARIINKTVN